MNNFCVCVIFNENYFFVDVFRLLCSYYMPQPLSLCAVVIVVFSIVNRWMCRLLLFISSFFSAIICRCWFRLLYKMARFFTLFLSCIAAWCGHLFGERLFIVWLSLFFRCLFFVNLRKLESKKVLHEFVDYKNKLFCISKNCFFFQLESILLFRIESFLIDSSGSEKSSKRKEEN